MAEQRGQEASAKVGKMGTAHGGPQKSEPRGLHLMGKGKHGQGNTQLTVTFSKITLAKGRKVGGSRARNRRNNSEHPL